MVKTVVKKLRPGKGFAHFFHLSLVAVIPPLVYIFVRLEFYGVALAIVLLSKWRIFAVRPRHWLAHLRTNAVDIIVGLSLLTFMISANGSMKIQLFWLVIYEIWLLFIKPGTSTWLVSLQALLAQFAGLVAIFIAFEAPPLIGYIAMVAGVAYLCARHLFAAFEETHAQVYAWLWAFFAGCLMWVLGHWLLMYGAIAQPALLLSVIGYGLAALYYLNETDRLSVPIRRQIVFVVLAVVFVVVALSSWNDTIVR